MAPPWASALVVFKPEARKTIKRYSCPVSIATSQSQWSNRRSPTINALVSRDVALMVSLYRECVRACKDAIAKYSLNSDVTKSCSVANKILSSACSNYCPSAEHDCKLEVLDNANRCGFCSASKVVQIFCFRWGGFAIYCTPPLSHSMRIMTSTCNNFCLDNFSHISVLLQLAIQVQLFWPVMRR